MADKTQDSKCRIMYEADVMKQWRWVTAIRHGNKVSLDASAAGPPDMTLDQLDKFCDKVKQLVQDARELLKQEGT